MILPERAQSGGRLRVLDTIDRRLICIGGVVVELYQVAQQINDVRFGADSSDHICPASLNGSTRKSELMTGKCTCFEFDPTMENGKILF